MTRKLILLGATGSIGRSARDVIAPSPRRLSTVTAVVGGSERAGPRWPQPPARPAHANAALADGAALPALREGACGQRHRLRCGGGAVMEAVAY